MIRVLGSAQIGGFGALGISKIDAPQDPGLGFFSAAAGVDLLANESGVEP